VFPFAAAARGLRFQGNVTEMPGATENRINLGGTVPDIYEAGEVIVEIKDVQYLYTTSQIELQLAAAEAEGIPLYVVVSPTTTVATTVTEAVALTGGEVAVADVAAGTITGVVTGADILEILGLLLFL